MVITAPVDVPPEVERIAEPRPASTERLTPQTRRLYCPRCETRLVSGYDEPQCLSCGYADYSHTSELDSNRKRSIVSTATRFILRYVGDFPTLTERLAHVRLVRVRNRVVFDVNCPFCDNAMDQSSLSGKRPEVREQRYRCDQGHRVSLVPGKAGMMGWR